ncbi:MAG: DUF3021 family protein [Oscillospiraceae bacterium]|jgi:hypothetical protein|nr:DUF3021 family protein [Oscillospiraceae bacterium]
MDEKLIKKYLKNAAIGFVVGLAVAHCMTLAKLFNGSVDFGKTLGNTIYFGVYFALCGFVQIIFRSERRSGLQKNGLFFAILALSCLLLGLATGSFPLKPVFLLGVPAVFLGCFLFSCVLDYLIKRRMIRRMNKNLPKE